MVTVEVEMMDGTWRNAGVWNYEKFAESYKTVAEASHAIDVSGWLETGHNLRIVGTDKSGAKPRDARKALWIRLVKQSFPKLDMAMMEIIYRYGWYAGLRYCKTVGIDFEDCYYMVFGKEPRKV